MNVSLGYIISSGAVVFIWIACCMHSQARVETPRGCVRLRQGMCVRCVRMRRAAEVLRRCGTVSAGEDDRAITAEMERDAGDLDGG